MKVVHVLNTNKFSGAENVAIQIINLVSNKSFNMIYCSPYGEIADRLEKENIEYYPIKKTGFFQVRKMIKALKPDLIHAHDFRSSLVCSFACKKTPFISHIHQNPLWLKTKNIKSILFKKIAKHAKFVIGVSNSILDEFYYRDLIKDKFIDLSNPLCCSEIIEKGLKLTFDKKFDLCYLGRLSKEKNPLYFIKLVHLLKSSFPTIRACLIGDGVLKDDIIAAIEKFDLKENIDLFGFIENPFPILKNCKLLCIPSIVEGFGLAAYEALCLSLPVVCSNVGGLRNIVDDSCGKICDNDNEYIEFISYVLSNEEVWKKLSIGANKRAKYLDNKNEYKEKITEMYLKAVGVEK